LAVRGLDEIRGKYGLITDRRRERHSEFMVGSRLDFGLDSLGGGER